MENKSSYANALPVLFGFFVMGFCDVVGITSAHVKEDLLGAYSPEFRDPLSNLIPVALFSMFLIFSVHVRQERKRFFLSDESYPHQLHAAPASRLLSSRIDWWQRR